MWVWVSFNVKKLGSVASNFTCDKKLLQLNCALNNFPLLELAISFNPGKITLYFSLQQLNLGLHV